MGKASAAALEPYHWKAGDPSPNPAGRPKGSRSKLQEIVLKALYEDFANNGVEAIERVRQRKPEVYLMACVSLLPKQAEKVQSPFSDISDAELDQLEAHLAAVRAKMVKTIEGDATSVTAEPRSRVADEATEGTKDSASRQEGDQGASDEGGGLEAEQPVLPLDDAA